MNSNSIKIVMNVEGEVYEFSIYRDFDGELKLVVPADIPHNIRGFVDEVWASSASSII